VCTSDLKSAVSLRHQRDSFFANFFLLLVPEKRREEKKARRRRKRPAAGEKGPPQAKKKRGVWGVPPQPQKFFAQHFALIPIQNVPEARKIGGI
jgi:hypothetical protein